MKTHMDQIALYVPNLLKIPILDLGSGRGKFLITILEMGGNVVGFEKNRAYIEQTFKEAKSRNIKPTVLQGVAEELPFPDGVFGFINMAEVIEHVENPGRVLEESFRVLRHGGKVYVSVPSRFSIKDPHFHLWFVNWLPRRWADSFINFFGRHKDYQNVSGRQRLSDMHYYRYYEFTCLADKIGFSVLDTREWKIRRLSPPLRLLGMVVYRIIRPFYFTTFHFILEKK